MTYKESFLINLLKNMFYEFINGKEFKTEQDIYDSIPYGDGIHDYIIIPEVSTINRPNIDDTTNRTIFNLQTLCDSFNKNDIVALMDDELEDNIYYHLETYREYPIYEFGYKSHISHDKEFYVDYTVDGNSIIDITKKLYCDKQDKDKINVKLYSIKEACDSNHNNEYTTLIDEFVYACSSKTFDKQNVLLISKEYILNDLEYYVKTLLIQTPNEYKNITSVKHRKWLMFKDEVFLEFLKKLSFDEKYKSSLEDEN